MSDGVQVECTLATLQRRPRQDNNLYAPTIIRQNASVYAHLHSTRHINVHLICTTDYWRLSCCRFSNSSVRQICCRSAVFEAYIIGHIVVAFTLVGSYRFGARSTGVTACFDIAEPFNRQLFYEDFTCSQRQIIGPIPWAIAVPSVTRCRCCCGHRFYIAIHQVSLLSHAACAIAIAGFGSSCLGRGVDSSDTW